MYRKEDFLEIVILDEGGGIHKMHLRTVQLCAIVMAFGNHHGGSND